MNVMKKLKVPNASVVGCALLAGGLLLACGLTANQSSLDDAASTPSTIKVSIKHLDNASNPDAGVDVVYAVAQQFTSMGVCLGATCSAQGQGYFPLVQIATLNGKNFFKRPLRSDGTADSLVVSPNMQVTAVANDASGNTDTRTITFGCAQSSTSQRCQAASGGAAPAVPSPASSPAVSSTPAAAPAVSATNNAGSSSNINSNQGTPSAGAVGADPAAGGTSGGGW